MRLIAMWIYRQVRAVRKHKTGRKCSYVCIYAGQKAKDSRQSWSRFQTVMWLAWNRQLFAFQANTLLVGCVPKLGFIAWCVKARLILITAAIPRSQRRSSILKLMMILISKSTLRIYVSTFIVLQERVVSTWIKPNLRCELPICHRGLWCNVRTVVHNIKIKIRQWNS